MNAMRFLFALLALFIASCATSHEVRYSHLEWGMTRQQVVALLGEPRSTTSNGALITMEYNYPEQQPGRKSFYVIIGRDERVRSFGPN